MKIAILTNFMEFQPGYSLTGIVKDQVTMLSKHGHEVHLFVNTGYNGESFPGDVKLRKEVPFTHLKDYRSERDLTQEHQEIIEQTRQMYVKELKEFDFAFTHDFVFTGWFLPYGRAARLATPDLPNLLWLHWIHSVPSVMSDWWAIKAYGDNHKLVFPNKADRIRVAEQYRGEMNDVRVIPHIKDIRTFFDFSDDTCRFIDRYPGVLQADIVQLLPASVDRLSAKRVKEVIDIFGFMKQRGRSVCLVVACQWATGKQQKEDVNFYKKHAMRRGLNQQEVIFTCDFESPKFDVGIPKRMIRELFQCSNLFIFPTREESFGLVIPEAALAGGNFLVLNKNLDPMMEISGNTCLYYEFGSHTVNFTPNDPDKYYEDLAIITMARMVQNEAVMSKTFMRKQYNMDNLYENYYFPIMSELKHHLKVRREG